tara:strand:+ start:692 stop:1201 length:510 start_codon:yes stop_codon:yes gene_type:complete
MDWKFKLVHRAEEIDLTITETNVTLGDAFSPETPATRLSTMNWTTSGTVKLYSANMDFIAEYGAGERMMVSDPVHLAYSKAVLIASSPEVKYYCLSGRMGGYWTGEVITLSPNESMSLTGILGKAMFVSSGSLVGKDTHALVHFKTLDTYDIQAGEEGAILAIAFKEDE